MVAVYWPARVVVSDEKNVATVPLKAFPSTALIDDALAVTTLSSAPVMASSSENQVVCPAASGPMKLTVPVVFVGLLMLVK